MNTRGIILNCRNCSNSHTTSSHFQTRVITVALYFLVFLHTWWVYLVYNFPKLLWSLPVTSCDSKKRISKSCIPWFRTTYQHAKGLFLPQMSQNLHLHTTSWATVLVFLSAVESWLSRLACFTLEPQTKAWSEIPNGSPLWLLQNFSSPYPNLKLLTSMCPGSEPHTKSSLDDWAQARSKWPCVLIPSLKPTCSYHIRDSKVSFFFSFSPMEFIATVQCWWPNSYMFQIGFQDKRTGLNISQTSLIPSAARIKFKARVVPSQTSNKPQYVQYIYITWFRATPPHGNSILTPKV